MRKRCQATTFHASCGVPILLDNAVEFPEGYFYHISERYVLTEGDIFQGGDRFSNLREYFDIPADKIFNLAKFRIPGDAKFTTTTKVEAFAGFTLGMNMNEGEISHQGRCSGGKVSPKRSLSHPKGPRVP